VKSIKLLTCCRYESAYTANTHFCFAPLPIRNEDAGASTLSLAAKFTSSSVPNSSLWQCSTFRPQVYIVILQPAPIFMSWQRVHETYALTDAVGVLTEHCLQRARQRLEQKSQCCCCGPARNPETGTEIKVKLNSPATKRNTKDYNPSHKMVDRIDKHQYMLPS
jgi:hypothetical protein